MLKIILVRGFRPPNFKIAQFPGEFRHNVLLTFVMGASILVVVVVVECLLR